MNQSEILANMRYSEEMTQEQMAKKLGISKSLYAKLEYGERNISNKLLQTIKTVYPDVDINIFFGKSEHISCSKKTKKTSEILERMA